MKHKDTINPKPLFESEKEKQEFIYPMWFKSRENGRVVKFMDITVGEVIEKGNGRDRVGYKSSDWVAHTHTEIWEQVENPNEHLDRLDDIVDEVIKEMDTSKNNGGKTDYYQLENAPFKINDFDDFAEWRGLNGNQFNMGKVMWTFNVGRHSATDYERELNKIQHYLDREKLRISRLKKA